MRQKNNGTPTKSVANPPAPAERPDHSMFAALEGALAGTKDGQAWSRSEERLRQLMGFLDQAMTVIERGGGDRTATVPPRAEFQGHDGRTKEGLSPREVDVVRRLVSGVAVPGIARDTGISPHTVRNHLKAAFRKLGVHTQIELVHRAVEMGLVKIVPGI